MHSETVTSDSVDESPKRRKKKKNRHQQTLRCDSSVKGNMRHRQYTMGK